MDENLIEWTLLRERNYLQNCIKDFKIKNKILQQFTTKYGRVDFAHKTKDNKILITELETIINSNAKFSYCIEQVKSYKNIKLNNLEHIFIILIAKQTPKKFQDKIKKFCEENSIYFYTYDLERVKILYEKEIKNSLINVGAPLVNPVAMNLTHLSSFNRIFSIFLKMEKSELDKKYFKENFPVIGSGKSESTFNVILNGAEHFDLLRKERDKIILTDYGKRFCENINYISENNIKRFKLSLEQKRILIESLLNGNFYEKKSKTNIYYFLKFLILTNGNWIPRSRGIDNKGKIDFINTLFDTNYKEGVLCDLIKFTLNHCEELGIVERIKTKDFYDKAKITSLGSRILHLMDLTLSLKREVVQIPLQVKESEKNE